MWKTFYMNAVWRLAKNPSGTNVDFSYKMLFKFVPNL
jgi:hypothetical protein